MRVGYRERKKGKRNEARRIALKLVEPPDLLRAPENESPAVKRGA
jgi:hypothetical protein